MKSNCKVRGLALLLGGALIVGLIASGVGAADYDSGSPHEVVTVYEPHRGGDVKVLKATPPDLPSPEEVVEQYDTRKIRINDRHSPGQIVEVTSQGEIIDMEDTRGVRSFVTSFTYSRGLWGKVRYFGIDPDGTPRVGVVSREVIEEFQGLGIPIRLEIIDLDEVMPLKEAAREIGEKWYVMGASYNHATGRVHVSLVKPNWHRYVEVYQQYPDLPLWFNLDDPYPPPLAEPRDELPDEITDTWPDISYGGGEETSDGGGEEIGVTQVTSHGGGEEIDVFHPHYPDPDWAYGATSGFPAFYEPEGENVMVTAGHGALPWFVYSYVAEAVVGITRKMVSWGWAGDAGFYPSSPQVTFQNVINTFVVIGDTEYPVTYDIDGWWHHDVNVGTSIRYASGGLGEISGEIIEVTDTYIRYERSDGQAGDSGSPVWWTYAAAPGEWRYILGVHTHGPEGVGPDTEGVATRIGRVQELLNVTEP